MTNTEALRARLLAHAEIHDAETSPYSPEQAQWAADLREAAAALAQQPAASGEPVAWQLPGSDSIITAEAKAYRGVLAENWTVPLYTAPQPAPARVPPGWVMVQVPPVECTCSAKDMPFGRCCKVPPERETDKWESCRVADFNAGWNACRAAMLAAAPAAPDAQTGEP